MNARLSAVPTTRHSLRVTISPSYGHNYWRTVTISGLGKGNNRLANWLTRPMMSAAHKRLTLEVENERLQRVIAALTAK
jgi:hypothetical protein